MRLIETEVENFCSYDHALVNFENLGLTLIHGVSGSGKSSIMDFTPWTLLGVTSKELAADDVKSWFAEGPTRGRSIVETPTGKIEVFRQRGTSSNQNDLYYREEFSDAEIRGKDMVETQKLINQRLGITPELYLTGAYIHQFSGIDQFFVSKAKDRRELLEKIADLAVPMKLAEKSSEARKVAKKDLEIAKDQLARAEGKLEQAKENIKVVTLNLEAWNKTHSDKIQILKDKAENFEKERHEEIHKLVTRLEELDNSTVSSKEFDKRLEQWKLQEKALRQAKAEHKDTCERGYKLKGEYKSLESEYGRLSMLDGKNCPTCLGPGVTKEGTMRLQELKGSMEDLFHEIQSCEYQLKNLEQAVSIETKLRKDYDKIVSEKSRNDRLLDEFESIQARVLGLRDAKNTYAEMTETALQEKNPFEKSLKEAQLIIESQQKSCELLSSDADKLQHKVSSLTWLYDKSYELRGMMLERSVKQLNDAMNLYLEKYFDADLRVQLSLKDQDKIEVELNNSGYPCKYTQLSGGERCLLNFTLKFAVMALAEDKAGIKFSTIMLDEVLNGLDENLKLKAFPLLQSLESRYESIILIDHCTEFKNLFDNRMQISKNGNYSVIQHE